MFSVIKKIIPYRHKKFLKKTQETLKHKGVVLFSKTRSLASLYFLLFDRGFSTEMQAVLKGNVEFKQSSSQPKRHSPQLRRNIHRLEKGLCMPHRREYFGEAFIVETVELYNAAIENDQFSISEKEWARDILDAYFSSVTKTEIIQHAFNMYSKEPQDCIGKLSKIPYQRINGIRADVAYDDFLKLTQQRRSVRWYQDSPVPDELLDKAILAASLAPSACNRQPYEFLVINNKELASKILAVPAGTAGFSDQAPCAVLVIGDLSCYPTAADRHVIYIDGALASMQFMLALETLGLSSCGINWPEISSREQLLKKHIKLPEHKRVIMLMSVGFAKNESMIPFSAKKNVFELKSNIERYL